MNKVIKTISSIVRTNTNKTVNIFVINTSSNINEITKNNIVKNNKPNNIQKIEKYVNENKEELKYLEKKSLEFAIKN